MAPRADVPVASSLVLLVLLHGSSPCGSPVVFVVRGTAAVARGRCVPLPVTIRTLPGPGQTRPTAVLLDRHRRARLFPRSAVAIDGQRIQVLQGTVEIDSHATEMEVAIPPRLRLSLRGRLLVRAAYPGGERTCSVVSLDGEARMAGRTLTRGLALRVSEDGKVLRMPAPRLLLPPPVTARLASEEPVPVGSGDAPAGSTVASQIASFRSWEQDVLRDMWEVHSRLAGEVRLRLMFMLLERGETGVLLHILPTLTVSETLALRTQLHGLLLHEDPGVCARAEAALARTGDLDATWSVALLRDVPTVRSGYRSSMRPLVEEILSTPFEARPAHLLETWARRGITRLHLETFLGTGHLPRVLLDPELLQDGTRSRRQPTSESGALRRLRYLERQRVRRRREVERACLTALTSGAPSERESALSLGHHCGGYAWGDALARELEHCHERDLRRVAAALASLLERAVSRTWVERFGLRPAWRRTMDAVYATWIPRGYGLVWGEPDRTGGYIPARQR